MVIACLKVLSILALTAVLALGSEPKRERDENSVRLMSFNIRYDEPRDGANAWANRKERVADVIRFHKADLIGLQEALLGQLRDLETLLPGFGWCGAGRADGKQSGEYSAIVYRRSRFDIRQCKTFWLSPTPDVAGSKGWDAALPRIVTWARFRDRETGKSFFHFNTHFDHVGQVARVESAKLMLRKINDIAGSLPYFVSGDFNVVESNEAYKTLVAGTTEVKLRDARYAALHRHFGGDSTWTGFKDIEPGRRIDYLFVGPRIRVVEHGILADQWNGSWASDHLPVLGEIEVR